MKPSFPHKLQYAMNLTNGSQEAIDRVNQWHRENNGDVEHKTTDQIREEVLPRLKKGDR
jgi:hypothetical protein